MQEDARQLIQRNDAEAADMTDELELDQLAETELTDVPGSQSNVGTTASDADAPPATEAN
jgi:hypothetical protein